MSAPVSAKPRPSQPPDAPEAGAAEAAAEVEYTIDQLAAASAVPSRTIRYYRSAGALAAPRMRGRVAYYGPGHLERLQLIAELQDRGLTIKAICDLVRRIDKGELDLGEWLGLGAQLGEPWASDGPRVVTEDELYELTGKRQPGLLAELRRLRLVERKGDAVLIPSPGVLHAAIRLEKAGVDLETAVEGLGILEKHARRSARDLAKYFFKRAAAGFDRGASTAELAQAFGTLRPVSQDALQLFFAREMERELRERVESGKAADISRRKPGARGGKG
ncbi:MAG: MerR family transcriptional regulator [Polyangiaceae bacterium]